MNRTGRIRTFALVVGVTTLVPACQPFAVDTETRDWIDGLLEPPSPPTMPEPILLDPSAPGGLEALLPTDVPFPAFQARWVVVDTGQSLCYDAEGNETDLLSWPRRGEPFHGQDAQYLGTNFDYTVSADGLTVYDGNTRLTWTQAYARNPLDSGDFRFTFEEAGEYVGWLNAHNYGGFNDWRVPEVKELYSLTNFTGNSNGDTAAADGIPYIDTSVFEFRYGDEDGDGVDEADEPEVGSRAIDAQYWSSTQYVGRVYNDDQAAFGVNFADGRIKGYVFKVGTDEFGAPTVAEHFLRAVRGSRYGVNRFDDNEDGTITDQATGLMWTTADSGAALDWEEALAHAEGLSTGGYDDWRLPNAKELQSIVDYTWAPDAVDPSALGPALDPIFDITDWESYFWTSTTHIEAHLPPPASDGSFAAYVCFGQAIGNDRGTWLNVHGAGAQRSDPKRGDPAALADDFPNGLGPQGDDLRVYNYARWIRQGLWSLREPAATSGLNLGQAGRP